MASDRRRRSSSSSRGTASAPPPRKQRKIKPAVRKNKKVPAAKIRKKPGQKQDIKSRLQKLAIVVFFAADIVLIYFFIRHCSTAPAPPPDDVQKAAVEEVSPRILQIEVLNGCGVSGIAARFTDYLRDEGFDVVKTDNYKENEREKFNMPHTVVIDRRGKVENAVRVAKALGLPERSVLSEPNEAYLIDATVILGEDFKQLNIWTMLERTYD